MSRLVLVLSILVATLVACSAPAAVGAPTPSRFPSQSPAASDFPPTPAPSMPVATPSPSARPPSTGPSGNPAPSAPTGWSWHVAIDTFDCLALAATVDPSGRFHLAVDCDAHIQYATSLDGTSWTSESILPAVDTIETEPQVVVDDGRVHVAFNRYVPLDEGCGGVELRHVGGFVQFRGPGGWSTQRQIGDEGDVLVALRVVDGVIHALVRNEGLFYLRIDASGSTRVMVAEVGTGSLRVGDDGVPRIAFVANEEIRYGRIEGGRFTSEAVATVYFSAGSPELVLAPGNRPYILWTQNSEIEGCASPGPQPTDGTYVATQRGGSWTIERVTPAVGQSSITLDLARGNVHLAVATDAIRHFVSTSDGADWSGEVVPASSEAHHPVIRIDPVSGRIGIAAMSEKGVLFFQRR